MTAYFPSTGERLAAPIPRPNAVRPINVTLITQEQAEALHSRILASFDSIGRDLNTMRATGGWQLLADAAGRHYQNWTDYLNRAFKESRKHLYELMNAAEVTERLQKELNTSQAYALSRFDSDIQKTIYDIAEKRPGGATEDRIKAIGAALTEAKNTGYVTAGQEGEQVAFEAAIKYERREIAMQKWARNLLVDKMPFKTNAAGQVTITGLPAGAVVYVSVWTESEDK